MDSQVDLFSAINKIYQKGLHYIYTYDFLYQSLAIALALLLSHYLATATKYLPLSRSRFVRSLRVNKIITFYELTYYIYFLILLWIVQSLFGLFHLEEEFVIIMLIATIFWGLLRLTFSLVTYSQQTRVVTFVLWLILLLVLFGNKAKTFTVLKAIQFEIAGYAFNLLYITEAVLLFTFFVWLAQLFSSLVIRKIMESEHLSPSYRVLYSKLVKMSLFVIAILIGLSLLGINIMTLAVFTGAIGLGAGIGLQRVVSNFVSGFILLMD